MSMSVVNVIVECAVLPLWSYLRVCHVCTDSSITARHMSSVQKTDRESCEDIRCVTHSARVQFLLLLV